MVSVKQEPPPLLDKTNLESIRAEHTDNLSSPYCGELLPPVLMLKKELLDHLCYTKIKSDIKNTDGAENLNRPVRVSHKVLQYTQ